jgi:hypothetical protein
MPLGQSIHESIQSTLVLAALICFANFSFAQVDHQSSDLNGYCTYTCDTASSFEQVEKLETLVDNYLKDTNILDYETYLQIVVFIWARNKASEVSDMFRQNYRSAQAVDTGIGKLRYVVLRKVLFDENFNDFTSDIKSWSERIITPEDPFENALKNKVFKLISSNNSLGNREEGENISSLTRVICGCTL